MENKIILVVIFLTLILAQTLQKTNLSTQYQFLTEDQYNSVQFLNAVDSARTTLLQEENIIIGNIRDAKGKKSSGTDLYLINFGDTQCWFEIYVQCQGQKKCYVTSHYEICV